MTFLIENWALILGLSSLAIAAGLAIKHFWGLPTNNQIVAVKKWLLWAVIQAEKELGAKTGQVKLRFVYDMFVVKFPWVAKVISFELFSQWVDGALDEMKALLNSNVAIAEYVVPAVEPVGTI